MDEVKKFIEDAKTGNILSKNKFLFKLAQIEYEHKMFEPPIYYDKTLKEEKWNY